jgi:hypothetical protein
MTACKHLYLGDFGSWADVAKQFEADIGDEPELAYAIYDIDGYEGSANVVFRRDGVWYMARGSHCSCMGLEGQWELEYAPVGDHLRALGVGKSIINCYANQDSLNSWLRWALEFADA